MLPLLFDEDVHGDIVDGLRRRLPAHDMVRVHDVGLRQTPDPLVLQWAAENARIIVSVDKKTLAGYAWDRVALGKPMPGVAILRGVLTIGEAVRELELIALAGNPEDFENCVIYLPL